MILLQFVIIRFSCPPSFKFSLQTQISFTTAKTITLWGHEQVNALQHIQKELITAVLDALSTPAYLPSHLAGDLRLLLLGLWCHMQKDTSTGPETCLTSDIN